MTTKQTDPPSPDPSLVPPARATWVEYGGFWRRLGANIIDSLIFVPFGLVSIFLMLKVSIWIFIPMQIVLGAISVAYATVLHAKHGATFGKMATGLSVRSLDLTRIGWDQAVWRSSVDYAFTFLTVMGNIAAVIAIPKEDLLNVDIIGAAQLLRTHQSPLFSLIQTLFSFWIWSEVLVLLFNKKKRSLHDFIAGTVVVISQSLPLKVPDNRALN